MSKKKDLFRLYIDDQKPDEFMGAKLHGDGAMFFGNRMGLHCWMAPSNREGVLRMFQTDEAFPRGDPRRHPGTVLEMDFNVTASYQFQRWLWRSMLWLNRRDVSSVPQLREIGVSALARMPTETELTTLAARKVRIYPGDAGGEVVPLWAPWEVIENTAFIAVNEEGEQFGAVYGVLGEGLVVVKFVYRWQLDVWQKTFRRWLVREVPQAYVLRPAKEGAA